MNRQGINYQPFDALEGFKEEIRKKDYEYLKEKRKVLSEDQINEMNLKLTVAVKKKLIVTIKYYKNGYYNFHTGYIKKINDFIIFEDRKSIPKNDLIEIT